MVLSTPSRKSAASIAIAIAAAVTLAACGKKEKPPPPPPPPQVSYVTLVPRSVTLTTDLPGRTTAFRVAEVRPQVSGVIQKRLFVEGANVKAGQQLYQIDPAPFRAALDSALAAQQRAEASLVAARLLEQRYKPLAEARAVSRQEYDNATSSRAQGEADVASAKASVATARINLVYTRVLSPISGRTGRSSVTEGALVQAGQTTALVTVSQLDPIYVDVVQSSTALLRLKRELASGKLKQIDPDKAKVGLRLEDGVAYAYPGVLKFSEVTVDPGTGSVTLRAEMPNPNGTLLPGMFVHLRLEEGVTDGAILVPQQGVTRDAKGEPTALVVGPEFTVQLRRLKVDRAIGDEWLVTEGLVTGDKVIVAGLQSAKPDARVRATETTKAELNRPAPPPPPASGASGAASGAGASAASR